MKTILVALLLCCAAFVQAQNPAIHVEKIGKGTPVIFMPGFITPGSVWKETVQNLKGKYEA
ncbi:MAG TPA: hypothetical protein VFM90_10345, partial [Cyclobacteriaceae bacterium]|nr:hypothetical protein [Cyclobacteriaceae bacterium]